MKNTINGSSDRPQRDVTTFSLCIRTTADNAFICNEKRGSNFDLIEGRLLIFGGGCHVLIGKNKILRSFWGFISKEEDEASCR